MTGEAETFALNPAAIRMSCEAGAIADPEPSWQNDPNLPGAKLSVSPMILSALKLC